MAAALRGERPAGAHKGLERLQGDTQSHPLPTRGNDDLGMAQATTGSGPSSARKASRSRDKATPSPPLVALAA